MRAKFYGKFSLQNDADPVDLYKIYESVCRSLGYYYRYSYYYPARADTSL